jgi:hypothetical protein
MKKITRTVIGIMILALTLCLLFSLSACGNNDETPEEATAAPTETVTVTAEPVEETEAPVETEEVVESIIPVDTPVPTADANGMITYTSLINNFSFRFDQQYITMTNPAGNAVVYAGGDTELPFCNVSIIFDADAADYLTQMADASVSELGDSIKTAAGEPQSLDYGDRDIYYISYTFADEDAGGTVACVYYAENLDNGNIVVYSSTALDGATEAVDSILQTAIETFTLN